MIKQIAFGQPVWRSIGWSIALWLSVATSVFAQSALERLEQGLLGRTTIARPARGVEQPYLGFRGDTSIDGGVEVLSVDRGGPAEQAGVRIGDVITRFDTTRVAGLATLSRAVAGVGAGQTVPIRLRRLRTSISTTMRVGQVAGGATPESPTTPPATTPSSPTKGSLGVSVVPITESARVTHGLRVRQGALISSIVPGSGAARAGIRAGSAVIAVDGRRVQRPEDLIAIVNSARIGQTLQLSLYEGTVLQLRDVTVMARPTESPSGLESRLGDGGKRPVLGALGRLLDDVVGKTPAPLAGPLPLPPTPLPESGALRPGGADGPDGLRLRSDDVAILSEQIRRLQETIDRLEQRVARLEGATPVEKAAPNVENLPAPKLPLPPQAPRLEIKPPKAGPATGQPELTPANSDS